MKNETFPLSPHNNFVWLLFAILSLYLASALTAQLYTTTIEAIMDMALTAIVLLSIWSVAVDRLSFSVRFSITVLLILLELCELVFEHYHLRTAHLAFLLAFTLATIAMAGRQVLLTGTVNFNKIVGSICIYLLIGMAWAFAYLLVERIFPGSIPRLGGDYWRENWQDALYFSYVTLTTLGYGDVFTKQPVGRCLAYMQAVVGQFYIAILVASLVGARINYESGRETSSQNDQDL